MPRYMIERRFTRRRERDAEHRAPTRRDRRQGSFPRSSGSTATSSSTTTAPPTRTASTRRPTRTPFARRTRSSSRGTRVLDPGDHRRRLAGRLPARARVAAERARRPRSLIGACAAASRCRVGQVLAASGRRPRACASSRGGARPSGSSVERLVVEPEARAPSPSPSPRSRRPSTKYANARSTSPPRASGTRASPRTLPSRSSSPRGNGRPSACRSRRRGAGPSRTRPCA